MTLKKRRDNSRQVCSEKLDEKRVENVDTKHFNKDKAIYFEAFFQAFFDHFRWDELMANFNLSFSFNIQAMQILLKIYLAPSFIKPMIL